MADQQTDVLVVGGGALVGAVHDGIELLVLLGAVDHYNRVAKDTKKRVVGVLLGHTFKGQCHAVNSFAGALPACETRPPISHAFISPVPFEEDLRNPSVWYLDHNFLDSMARMFKKVNGGLARSFD